MTEITTSFGPNVADKQIIQKRVKEYYDFVQDVKNLNKTLEETKKRRDEAEEILIETFDDAGITAVKTAEGNFFFKFGFHASILADKKIEGMQWIKDQGHGDIIGESVNAKTFSTFIKEMMDEDASIELPEFVNTFTKKGIGYRRK